MRAAVILCVAFMLAVAAISVADVSDKMSYQGVLRDSGGDAVADGTYDITFSMYNVEAGGTPLWTETQSLSVEGGVVNALMGSVNPLNVMDFNEPYWLGITVEAEAEMSPRSPLTTVPYAARAVFVNEPEPDEDWTISGLDMYSNVDDNVGIGITTPNRKLHVHDELSGTTYVQVTNMDSGTSLYSGMTIGVQSLTGWVSQSAGPLRLGHGAADNSLNVELNGNVGIGMTVPTEKLQVDGRVKMQGFVMPTGAQVSYVLTSDGTGVGTWQPNAGPVATASAAGNVVLDAEGEATVEIPVFLIGSELRYQLTCIGGFAPVYVAEKASAGVFTIAGGEPGMEVSWQVVGE
jgi:hypothetical protein